MTPDNEREYIETRFKTQMASLSSSTPIGYENVPFRPSDSDTEFVDISVISNSEQNVSLGTTVAYRRFGFININVYVKKFAGTKRLKTLLETCASIFRNQEFNNITCRTAQYEASEDSDKWYKANITIDYFTTN